VAGLVKNIRTALGRYAEGGERSRRKCKNDKKRRGNRKIIFTVRNHQQREERRQPGRNWLDVAGEADAGEPSETNRHTQHREGIEKTKKKRSGELDEKWKPQNLKIKRNGLICLI